MTANQKTANHEVLFLDQSEKKTHLNTGKEGRERAVEIEPNDNLAQVRPMPQYSDLSSIWEKKPLALR